MYIAVLFFATNLLLQNSLVGPICSHGRRITVLQSTYAHFSDILASLVNYVAFGLLDERGRLRLYMHAYARDF